MKTKRKIKMLIALGIFLIAAVLAGYAVSKAENLENADVIKPLYPLEKAEDALADGGYSVSFSAEDLKQEDGKYTLTVKVFEYDRYETESIEKIRAGSQIQYCKKIVTVETVEKSGETGIISINGGLENKGIDLREDDGYYRTVGMDDYPIYYEIGDVTISLPSDLQFEDHWKTEIEPDGEVFGLKGFQKALESEEGIFNCTNTVITVRRNEILQIIRYWTP